MFEGKEFSEGSVNFGLQASFSAGELRWQKFDEWPGEFCGQGASECGLPGSGWAEEGNRSRHPKLEVIGQFAIEERIHNAAFNDGLLGPHAGNGCPFRGLEEFASPTVQNADVRRSQRFVLLPKDEALRRSKPTVFQCSFTNLARSNEGRNSSDSLMEQSGLQVADEVRTDAQVPLPHDPSRRNYVRYLCPCCLSSASAMYPKIPQTTRKTTAIPTAKIAASLTGAFRSAENKGT